MIKLALLGCAHIHTPRFIDMLAPRQDVRIASVWDRDEVKAARAATRINLSPSNSLQDALADVNGVLILSETDQHETLVGAVLEHPLPLFVEKPLGINRDIANRLAGAIAEAGVTFQTGYFMRGMAGYQYLKQQLAQGAFGTLTRARAMVSHGGALNGLFDDEWRWHTDTRQAGTGAFGDLGTHALDVLLWLLAGHEVARVTATIQPGTNRYGCDELGESLLQFDSGVIATVAAGWLDVSSPVTLELSGTNMHALVRRGEVFISTPYAQDVKAVLPPALPHAVELFCDAITGKDVPLVDVKEAAARVAIMDALYESAKQGRWLELPR
jgi:predicted dehydrogenase